MSMMARRCRRMVVLAFLTRASLELCGFVGCWRATGEGAPTRPMTLGVKAFYPAAAFGTASAATSLFDFITRQLRFFTSTFLQIELLPSGGEVGAHVEKLAKFVDSAQQEGNSIMLQSLQTVPEQPVEGTGFQRLMTTVLNDNRTAGLSAVHAEPGVGKSVATAMHSGITRRSLQLRCCYREISRRTSRASSGLQMLQMLWMLLGSCFVS